MWMLNAKLSTMVKVQLEQLRYDGVALIFGMTMMVLGERMVAGYPSAHPYAMARCSAKLEAALEQMFKKTSARSGFASHIDLSPSHGGDVASTAYHHAGSIDEKIDTAYRRNGVDARGRRIYEDYNSDGDDGGGDDSGDSGERADPQRRIEVAQLRVRLPPHHSRWVRVDKCQFLPNNRTLDTRLIFPDLTISGKVVVRPHGGQCSMILRLRQAGIEFRTVPVMEERSRAATVRTDSYFAEPGFISVFAHGCEGLTAAASGDRHHYRPNSKRHNLLRGNNDDEWRPPVHRRRHDVNGALDLMSAHDDIRFYDDRLAGDDSTVEDRTFSEYFTNSLRPKRRPPVMYGGGGGGGGGGGTDPWQNVELANSMELDEAFSRELEDLFSKGVRGLLTSYMQKALQPAIKETLMESMGYKLSYG